MRPATAAARAALVLAALPPGTRAGSNAASREWLDENKKKDGVVTLPSGLQYKVLRQGDGDAHPAKDSPCECHYKGTLIDGTQFDSSYDRGEPTTFAPNQVIKGWTEAMQLMVEGDKWEMYVPSELGYGDGGSGDKIKGGDALVFQMELLKIKGARKEKARSPAQLQEAAENVKGAPLCDPVTLKDCSKADESYVALMKGKRPEVWEREIGSLSKKADANDEAWAAAADDEARSKPPLYSKNPLGTARVRRRVSILRAIAAAPPGAFKKKAPKKKKKKGAEKAAKDEL